MIKSKSNRIRFTAITSLIALVFAMTMYPLTKASADTPQGTVTVLHINQLGHEIAPSVKLTGDVGSPYFAANLDIANYEITGVDGAFEGVFTDSLIQVTYKYNDLRIPDANEPVPEPEEEEGEHPPIDDELENNGGGEEVIPPVVEPEPEPEPEEEVTPPVVEPEPEIEDEKEEEVTPPVVEPEPEEEKEEEITPPVEEPEVEDEEEELEVTPMPEVTPTPPVVEDKDDEVITTPEIEDEDTSIDDSLEEEKEKNEVTPPVVKPVTPETEKVDNSNKTDENGVPVVPAVKDSLDLDKSETASITKDKADKKAEDKVKAEKDNAKKDNKKSKESAEKADELPQAGTSTNVLLIATGLFLMASAGFVLFGRREELEA